MKKKIAILGSTGSIGKSLINILKEEKKKPVITLLSTNKNYKELLNQANYFNVKNLIISDKKTFKKCLSKKIFKNRNLYNNFDSLNLIFKKKK
jgi:1-deoxy-D-xylulose-5-phosphate reductoisomerase